MCAYSERGPQYVGRAMASRHDDATHAARHALVDRVIAGMAEGLAFCIVLLGADLRIEWVSPTCERLLGYTPDEMVGLAGLDLVHPDDHASIAAIARDELEAPTPFGQDPASMSTATLRVRRKDGTWRPLEMASNNQIDNEQVRGFVLVLRDGTSEHHTLQVLHRLAAGEPLGAVLQAIVSLLLVQVEGATVEVAARDARGAEVRVVGGPASEGDASIVLSVQDAEPGSTVAVWVPGPEPTLFCRTLVEKAAGLVRLALTRDMGEAQLHRAAHTDALTGAWNRAGLHAHLAADAGRADDLDAVMYVDVDNFKSVNDELGHAAGDAVLAQVAERIRRCLRSGDILARPGGDEFVVVCGGLPDRATAERMAQRILDALTPPLEAHAVAINGAVSIGLALGHGGSRQRLLERADAALLTAKRTGKGRVVLYVD